MLHGRGKTPGQNEPNTLVILTEVDGGRKLPSNHRDWRGARNRNQTEDRRRESVSPPSEEARRAAWRQRFRPSSRGKRHIRHAARRAREARPTPWNSHPNARRPWKLQEVQAKTANRPDF